MPPTPHLSISDFGFQPAADTGFRSRAAAARWVAHQHAQTLA